MFSNGNPRDLTLPPEIIISKDSKSNEESSDYKKEETHTFSSTDGEIEAPKHDAEMPSFDEWKEKKMLEMHSEKSKHSEGKL